MTVCKSKYYMLKVNFPKLAEQVDSQPLIPDEEEEPAIDGKLTASKAKVDENFKSMTESHIDKIIDEDTPE